jgi:predicted deacetylase
MTARPQYLLRFDDICPTMCWKGWAKIEEALILRRLKPVLAVVPDNHDPTLQLDSPAGDFWDRVRSWRDRGWTIALHGYQHRYVSRRAGIAAAKKRSEFAGLPAEEQREKLRCAVEIFEREGITPQVWIAPSNTFDETTVALLPEFGIRVISAGYFQYPYACAAEAFRSADRGSRIGETDASLGMPSVAPHSRAALRHEILWLPQQMHYFRPAPAGVWTVCYHHNKWNGSRGATFLQELDRYGADIVSLEDILEGEIQRDGGWSAWLCAHPRLAEFLIRGELKLWSLWSGRQFGAAMERARING